MIFFISKITRKMITVCHLNNYRSNVTFTFIFITTIIKTLALNMCYFFYDNKR